MLIAPVLQSYARFVLDCILLTGEHRHFLWYVQGLSDVFFNRKGTHWRNLYGWLGTKHDFQVFILPEALFDYLTKT